MAALLEDQRSGGNAKKRWFTSSSRRAPLPSPSSRSFATDAPTVLSSSRTTIPSFDGPIIESTAHEPAVRITDTELLLRARAAKTQSQQQRSAHVPAFAIESRATRYRWRRRKHTRNGFALFSRESSERFGTDDGSSSRAVACHQVLAVGDVRCSVRELAHILRTASATEHNAVMRGLYEDDFIVGSVVHSTTPAAVATASTASRAREELLPQQLAVKTNVFARPNFFARNEQWCVLELFEHDAATDAFTLTLASLAARDVSAGKLQRAGEQRVVQLHGIIALLTVERVDGTASARVVFHSSFCDVPRRGKRASSASTRASKARVLALAAGLSRLPELVQRRRLGVQTPVDFARVVAANTRCPCCTRTLHVLSKKTQCYLCGYAVCDSDWAIHDMDAGRGCITPVRVCARCLEAVERCDYAHVTPESLGGVTVQPDARAGLDASVAPAFVATTTSSTSSETLATLLTDALHTSSAQRKQSVLAVIKHLVTMPTTTPSSASAPAPRVALTERSDDAAYVSALNAFARAAEPLPLSQCVLANGTHGRAYQLGPVRDHATLAREFPVPVNEAERLQTIATHRLLGAAARSSSRSQPGGSVAEQLDVICTLAARELGCSLSAITIISRRTQRIVASNVESFRMATMPRSESFCQHTVMTPAPLLVPHPEADVRFAHLQAQQRHAFRFYCGFPLTSASRAVVGTVCCLDTKSRALTQSQYATMARLAETASRILQLRGNELTVSQATTTSPGETAGRDWSVPE